MNRLFLVLLKNDKDLLPVNKDKIEYIVLVGENEYDVRGSKGKTKILYQNQLKLSKASLAVSTLKVFSKTNQHNLSKLVKVNALYNKRNN